MKLLVVYASNYSHDELVDILKPTDSYFELVDRSHNDWDKAFLSLELSDYSSTLFKTFYKYNYQNVTPACMKELKILEYLSFRKESIIENYKGVLLLDLNKTIFDYVLFDKLIEDAVIEDYTLSLDLSSPKSIYFMKKTHAKIQSSGFTFIPSSRLNEWFGNKMESVVNMSNTLLSNKRRPKKAHTTRINDVMYADLWYDFVNRYNISYDWLGQGSLTKALSSNQWALIMPMRKYLYDGEVYLVNDLMNYNGFFDKRKHVTIEEVTKIDDDMKISKNYVNKYKAKQRVDSTKLASEIVKGLKIWPK